MKFILINIILSLLPPTRFFAVKRRLLNRLGVAVGQGSCVCGDVRFYCAGHVVVGEDCWIGIGTRFYPGSGADIVIHDKCDIAPEVSFMTGTHDIGDHSRRAGAGRSESIVVESGTWIGTRSLLLGGCRVGAASVVGADSLLLGRAYPPSVLLVGAPARIVRELPGQ